MDSRLEANYSAAEVDGLPQESRHIAGRVGDQGGLRGRGKGRSWNWGGGEVVVNIF